MGNIYLLDNERQMILYESNNYICLRTINHSNLGRPIILCSNYKKCLSSSIINNMLYYSYINLDNDIIVKNIIDTEILYHLQCKDSFVVHNPFIISHKEKLLLTYILKNPLDLSYSIKAIYPLENKSAFELDYSYSDIPNIKCLNTAYSLIYQISSSISDSEPTFIEIKNDNTVKQLTSKNISTKISDNSSDFNYKEEVTNKDLIISNIKSQYNELMNTALEYKNEAKKWYDKYMDLIKFHS